MKSKLLLSLGLVSILGMAQASEGTPEVRNIMEMFARLSPADQASGSDTDMKTAPPALLKIQKLCLGSARMCAVVYL